MIERAVCKCGLWVVVWLAFGNDLIFRSVGMYMFVMWKDIQNFRGLRASVSRGVTSVSFTYSVKYFTVHDSEY